LTAPPVVSPPLPRRVEGQCLLLCDLGARSKAAGEPPSAWTPQASPAPMSSARTWASQLLLSTHLSGMASMAKPSTSRRFEALPAVARSVLDATRPCTVWKPPRTRSPWCSLPLPKG